MGSLEKAQLPAILVTFVLHSTSTHKMQIEDIIPVQENSHSENSMVTSTWH